MKALKINNVMSALVATLLFSSIAIGQGNEPPEDNFTKDISISSRHSIIEDNLTCFKSLDCLKSQLKSHITFEGNVGSNTDHYTIRAESRNEHFYAEYDKNGSLIHCEHKYIDIRLPKKIYQYLASSDFKDWMVIGSERRTYNFNPESTEIMVILQKDGHGKVLIFDSFGKPILPSLNV